MDEFNVKAELAQVGMAVQAARREMEALAKEKQDFLDKQAKEAKDIIDAALEASKNALSEASDAIREVGIIRDLAGDVAAKIAELRGEYADSVKDFDEDHTEMIGNLKAMIEHVSEKQAEVNASRSEVKLEKKAVQNTLSELEKERTLVKDERAKLKSALAETKKREQANK